MRQLEYAYQFVNSCHRLLCNVLADNSTRLPFGFFLMFTNTAMPSETCLIFVDDSNVWIEAQKFAASGNSHMPYRSTRKVKGVDGGKTIVLREVSESDEDAVCDQLLNTRRLFWKTRLDGNADLCIEFPKASQIGRLIIEARKLLPGITIVSWPEYRAAFFDKDHTNAVKTVNTYELLDSTFSAEDGSDDVVIEEPLEDSTPKKTLENPSGSATGNDNNDRASGNTNTGNDSDDNSDDGGWTTVQKTDTGRRHRSVVNRAQDCPYGARCMKKDDCGYRHTAEERQLFRHSPNRNLDLRKTQLCRYAPNCPNGRHCLYAPTEAEARCLDCRRTGHFQGDVTKCPLQT